MISIGPGRQCHWVFWCDSHGLQNRRACSGHPGGERGVDDNPNCFLPRPPDCSVKEGHFRRGEQFCTDKMLGGCQYEVYGTKNTVGISLRGIADSERTRSRCSDSRRLIPTVFFV